MDRSMIVKYFRDIPTMHTKRLILRRMLKRDAVDMYEYACDPTVTQFLLWEPHINLKYTTRYLMFLQSKYRSGEFYDWAVIDKAQNKMIGTCGFSSLDCENNSAEVGYVLNPSFWHRGIAPEALFEVIKFGFTVLGLNRIEAKYMIGNDNSRRVMEKVGMRFEGVSRDSLYVKGRYVSVGVCSVLRRDFMKYCKG